MCAHQRVAKTRARPGFKRPSWSVQVHPAFVNYWKAYRKNRGLPHIEDENVSRQKFEEWFAEMSVASRAFQQARELISTPVGARLTETILKPLDFERLNASGSSSSRPADLEGIDQFPQNPEASSIFRTIVFLKYGITFRELIRQIDFDKKPDAHKK